MLTQTLPDQLADLNVKCEILEQKYNRIKLENHEYKQLVTELEQQNKELIQEANSYKKTLNGGNNLIPMFKSHISAIEIELNDDEQLISTLKDKLTEYKQMNHSLQSENIFLHQENDRLRGNIVQKNKLQKQVSKRVDNDNHRLQSENQLLRDQLLTATSHRDLSCDQNPMEFGAESPSLTPPSPQGHNREETLRFSYNNRSPSSKSKTLSRKHRLVKTNTFGSGAFLNTEFMNFIACAEPQMNEMMISELTQRIDELEMVNSELTQKLTENKHCKTDSQDMNELFQKCEYEIWNDNLNHQSECDGSSSLIDKFRVRQYEIQLRRIQRRTDVMNQSRGMKAKIIPCFVENV